MKQNYSREDYRHKINDMAAYLASLFYAVPRGEKQLFWLSKMSAITDIFYSLNEEDTDQAETLYYRLRFPIFTEIKKCENFDTKYVNEYINQQMELSKDMPICEKVAVLCLAIQVYIMNVFLIYLRQDMKFVNKLYDIRNNE